MILNDKNVLEVLQQTNLLRNNNYYFSSTIMPSIGNLIMLGHLATFVKDFSGYLINYTEEGIGIIPLNNMTGNPMTDLAYFIEKSNIKSVNIENGGLFFYKKITITDINNESIIFKVVKNVLPMKKYKENLEHFISDYQN